jgi:predicted Fe-Mo cluster-binding NifX family protein
VSLPDPPVPKSLKIAVVTNNGETISRHFGRARSYLVVTIEDGRVVDRELRAKAGHDDFAGNHGDHVAGQPRGYGHSAPEKHRAMTESILDCGVLIAGGMGQGAHQAVQEAGIEALTTEERTIEVAIDRYLRGDLVNATDRLH